MQIICAAALFTAASAHAAGSAPAAAATTEERLQAALEDVVAEHQLVPGATAYVDAPRAALPWTGAAGQFAEGSPQPLSPEDPFRVASVQKPFTAAAILRLVEEDRLELDQPVAPFIDPDQVERMHVFDGVNHGAEITIRQLLRHTSGLNSHDECNEFIAAVGAGPRRRWTPREQIEMMIDCGDPQFAPDTPGRWHYSDTGYVMLGSVLAEVTGKSYAGALRELLPLEELGLDHTWHELLEPERADPRPRAHQYFGPADLTDWDPSFDSWGGGGYASTVEDLTLFIRALFDGRMFEKRSTLRLMKESVPVEAGGVGPRGAERYGLGLRFIRYGDTRCMGHTGFWSSIMLYCPSLDLAFAATTNQSSDEHMEHTEGYLAEEIVAIVNEAERSSPALEVMPRRAPSGQRVRYRFEFNVGDRPVANARIRFAGRRRYTDREGLAEIPAKFRHAGSRRARACKPGSGCASVRVKIVS